MGQSSSKDTRSVRIEAENSGNVIDISDNVVLRLKGDAAANKKANAEDKVKTSQKSPEIIPSSYSYPTPMPGTIIYAEPTITSQEVLRQKEIELKKNDEYWIKRMTNLSKTYKTSNNILEEEYNKTIENVKNQFEFSKPSHKEPTCVAMKENLIRCLDTNPKQSLVCSKIVGDFTKCVYQNK